MEIRIRETAAVVSEREFRAMHPSTSMPKVLSEDLLDSFGADPIFEGPQASGGTVYQYSQRSGVEQINGKWYTKYILGPIFVDGETTAAEQEAAYKAQKDAEFAASARTQRDTLLSECDWVVVKALESGQPIPSEWAEYRQALRDIPQQAGFPVTIDWPVKP